MMVANIHSLLEEYKTCELEGDERVKCKHYDSSKSSQEEKENSRTQHSASQYDQRETRPYPAYQQQQRRYGERYPQQ